MIGTEPIGSTPVERVTAYLDHLDGRDAQGDGWGVGENIHAFETLAGAYIISRSDLRMILNRLDWAEAEIDYLVTGE